MKRLWPLLLLLSFPAFAQFNSYQRFQPRNWIKLIATAPYPTPSFQADLESSITPQIGTGGTLTRGSSKYYWSGPQTLSVVTGNTPAMPAYQLDKNTVAGLDLHSGTTNFALQSEAPGTTWTAVGSPTITNGIGTWFDGDSHGIAYGSIAGVAGEGITQTTTIAAASRSIVASVWAQAVGTKAKLRIVIEGASGGTPETKTTADFNDIVVTPDEPGHYYLPVNFTGSATGNVKVTYTLESTSTVYVGGMMIERKDADATDDQYTRVPGPYVKTTTSTASQAADFLTYPASNFSSSSAFTVAIWANSDWRDFGNVTRYADSDFNNGDKYLIRMRDASSASILELIAFPNSIRVGVNGGNFSDLYERHFERRWYQYLVTVDYVNDVYKLYRNGVLIATDTTSLSTPGAVDSFYIGSPNAYRAYNGIVHKLKYWPRVLTDSEVAALFNAEVDEHREVAYTHGWPLSPNWHDPYTGFFLDFSESSGSLVDKINGATLTVNGSPTFGTTLSGRDTEIDPCVTYASGASHRLLSAVPALDMDLSTGDAMLEIYFKKTSTSGAQYLYNALGHGSTSDFSVSAWFSNDTTLNLALKEDSGTTKTCSWTIASLVDGKAHKARFHWGVHTLGKLWLDEVRQSPDCDDDVGATITNTGVRIGEKYDGSGSNFIGAICSVRASFSADDAAVTMTNSGGPLSIGSD